MVCLQETKRKETTSEIIRSLPVGRHMDWVAANAEGASGGILILWDKRVLQLIRVEESCFTLSCRFRNCEDSFQISRGKKQGW